MDLRNITMGFLFPAAVTRKSPAELERFASAGAANASRVREVEWWRDFARQGITQEQARASVAAFGDAFDGLEVRLADSHRLIEDRLTVLEIAWFISIHRLARAGYPMDRHPRLHDLYRRILQRPTFAREAAADTPGPLRAVLGLYQLYRRVRGTTLPAIALP